MKMRIKNSVNSFALIFLSAAIFGIAGCATPTSNPLAGWQVVPFDQPDKAIVKDYQDYIQKLPAKDNNSVGPIFYYEDGTGQHAVSMEIFVKGENASWHYVIYYDKENKRIKAIKYGYCRYQS